MRTKIVIVVLIGIICLMLLAACGTGAQDANTNGTQIVATFVARITQTANAAEIDSWLQEADATETPAAGLTEEPTETDVPFLTATPDPNLSLLSQFRTVTVGQGNLYVRDGLGVPVQITKSGTDHDPIISSDGKKIVFYRGEKFDNVFVINEDGSSEKELVNQKMLSGTAPASIVRYLTFIPQTHRVLFSRSFCQNSVCGGDVFLADTESAKLTELLKDADFSPANPNFSVSPNGQYIAVIKAQHVDLYDVMGKLVQSNILEAPHKDTLPLLRWFPDSSTLILVIERMDGDALWRYAVKENHAEQLTLDPIPANGPQTPCLFSVSPDLHWALYSDTQPKIYLGNLTTVQSQPYDWDGDCDVRWSPDSQHFASQTAIGSVDGTPPIKIDGHFIAWLDATHYLFSRGKTILDLQSYIAEVGKEFAAAPTNFIWSPVYAVLPYADGIGDGHAHQINHSAIRLAAADSVAGGLRRGDG